MAVACVGDPASENALAAVRLPDVELPGAGVGDEVDALHGAKCSAPGRVARVLHHGLQLPVGDEHPVKAREGHHLGVGDLGHREDRSGGGVLGPVDGVSRPLDDEPADEGGQHLGGADVEVAQGLGALGGHLAVVLVRGQAVRNLERRPPSAMKMSQKRGGVLPSLLLMPRRRV